MSPSSKTVILYFILAATIFVGLGLIALPGPHGGLVFLMPYLISLSSLKTDPVSSLLIYPPVLILAISGFLKNQSYRLIFSHLSILALLVFFFRFVQNVYPPVRYIAFITGALFFVSIAVAFVLPFFPARTSTCSKKFLVYESFLFLIVATLSVSALNFQWLPEKKVPLKIHSCETNLELIGQLFEIYLLSHPDYPADCWSDAVAQEAFDIEQTFLVCPLAKEGKCHYAMNRNATKDSPPDTVLLFESAEGWNLCGGIELAYTDRHSGCYILFNDKHVEFVTSERISHLNWSGK